jgi:hypothetical protein
LTILGDHVKLETKTLAERNEVLLAAFGRAKTEFEAIQARLAGNLERV